MLPLDVIAVFLPAAVALGLAPGPDNLFVLTQSAVNGRLAGLAVTLGLCTGIMVHTTAVALGVATIFQSSALAFTLLKLAGAGYLLFLAWKAFRAKPAGIGGAAPAAASGQRYYLRGVIMNVTNPKVALFFLAFLPQFADPARGAIVPQMLMLGAIFIAATLVVFGVIALAAGSLGGWLRRRPMAEVWLNRIAGVVFVGLAVKLVSARAG